MPISSNLGYSSIARPGVCTSGTRPASPYQGQVIYQTDTNTTLVWNGSGWVLLSTGTANPPALEFIASATVSAASTPAIDGCFTSTYAHYFVTYSFTTNISGQYTAIRLRSGGTPKIVNYDRVGYYNTTAGASGADGYASGASEWFAAGQSTYALVGNFYLYNPQISGRTGFTGHAAYPGAYVAQGSQTDTYQADGFQMFASGNAATYTGTMRVYGLRN